MQKIHKQLLWAVLISFLLAIVQFSYANQISVDKLVVFGDSLSDNGNLFAATKAANQKNSYFPIMPKALSYYQGRFSNGKIWAEHLAQLFNIPLADYAYGGAWVEAGRNPIEDRMFMPSISMQINNYLSKDALHDMSKDQHLYVIWGGANDYMFGYDPSSTNPEQLATKVVSFIKNQIELLILADAKNFIILNLPDFGTVPSIVEGGAEVARGMSQLSQLHNSKLAAMLTTLKETYPESAGFHFIQIDIKKYFEETIAHAAEHGLTNVKDACYPGGNLGFDGKPLDIECANPDEHVFWDKIHPTRKMHEILANRVWHELNQYQFVAVASTID